MAVNSSAAVSVLASSVVVISHQQSPFSSLSSISPPSIKLVSSFHCRKRVIISCSEAAKSASGVRKKSGVSVYKPRSYEVLVSDAATSLSYTLQGGKTRVEIDFPCVFLWTPTHLRMLTFFVFGDGRWAFCL